MKLIDYMATLSPKQKLEYGQRAGVPRGVLGNLTCKSGQHNPSASLAARLEEASDGVVTRMEVSSTCAACPHARAVEVVVEG